VTRFLSALWTLAALSILAVAGCGSSIVPTNSATVSSASAGLPLDPGSCAVQTPPGPADRVPAEAGDPFNTADPGNGRWRLCLQTPNAVSLEGSAVCTWNPDRTAVVEVDGLPLEPEKGVTIEGGARIGEGADVFMQRGTTASGDQLFSIYESPDAQPVRAVGGGRIGIGAFDLTLSPDPETSVPGSPPKLAGLIGWACGVAPLPERGRSTGHVALRLDQPVGLEWQLKAECDWGSVEQGDRLTFVQTDSSDIRLGDRSVAIAIQPDLDDPDETVARLFVDAGDEGAAYSSHGLLISAEQAADGRTGTLRLRHLKVDRSASVRLVDDTTDVSGIVRWECPPPVVPGPRMNGSHPPAKEREIPGTATLTFAPAISAPAAGAIRCTLGRVSRGQVQVTQIHGRLAAGDSTFVVRTFGGSVLVAVIGPDRQPAGEYIGQATGIADNARHRPLFIDVPSLAFEPTDPFYVPLGGSNGPRLVGLRVDYTCDLDAL
jgi:hypothetical protein